MRIILTLVQITVISLAVHTIISNNNDAFSFSIPEEMDYSVPFDFLSSVEDSSIDLDNFPNDNKSIDPKINYTYSFAGKVDSDMLLEGENEQSQKQRS